MHVTGFEAWVQSDKGLVRCWGLGRWKCLGFTLAALQDSESINNRMATHARAKQVPQRERHQLPWRLELVVVQPISGAE